MMCCGSSMHRLLCCRKQNASLQNAQRASWVSILIVEEQKKAIVQIQVSPTKSGRASKLLWMRDDRSLVVWMVERQNWGR